jgi:DNA-binding response OmpR family regulator
MNHPNRNLARPSRRGRWLLSSGDERTRIAIERGLAGGCEVFACDSDAVLATLAATAFDGLILDLDSLGFSGGRLLGEARRRGISLPGRIVFLCGESNAVAPPSAGEAVLLRKPIEPRALEPLLFGRERREREPVGRLALAAGVS